MTAIRVLPDPAALADTAARQIVELAQQAIDARGDFSVALSGGSTPRELHRLVSSPPLVQQVDWAHVQIFFGDERCVPPEDPESNYH
ncbi:MAG TPA: 6-phosphogluconolactonase, partial [Solirubrobacteraceae bacterium]